MNYKSLVVLCAALLFTGACKKNNDRTTKSTKHHKSHGVKYEKRETTRKADGSMKHERTEKAEKKQQPKKTERKQYGHKKHMKKTESKNAMGDVTRTTYQEEETY